MKSLWEELRPLLLCIAVFSFFTILLFLVPAMFTLQKFDLRLMLAGMPAKVYIEGVQQNPLECLMDPIISMIREAGRQM